MTEQLMSAANTFLMIFGGWALWAGLLFLAAGQIVEVRDVLDERDSRAGLGGLSSMEYAAHVIAITARTAAVALAFAARPLSAWAWTTPNVTGPGHAWTSSVAVQMIVGNMMLVGLHLWLMLPRNQRQPAALPAGAGCAA